MGFCVSRSSRQIPPISAFSAFRQFAVEPIMRNIEDSYSFRAVLKQGSASTVRSAIRIGCVERQTQVAVKSFKKANCSERELTRMREAISISRLFDHPKIVKFYELYEDERYLHIVREQCQGQNLSAKISLGGLSEMESKLVIWQVMWAVNYMHKLGFLHRGIRPQSIAYVERSEEAQNVKLVSFRRCAQKTNSQIMEDLKGDLLNYASPETIHGEFSESSDMWALGIMLYQLLSGKLPFTSSSERDVADAIEQGTFSFEDGKWSEISTVGKDLVRHMLLVDPKARLSLDQALTHPWFSSQRPELQPSVLHYIARFVPPKRLKMQIYRSLVKYTPERNTQELTDQFLVLDTHNIGQITSLTLHKQMSSWGISKKLEELQLLVEDISYYGKACLSFSDFVLTQLEKSFAKDEAFLFYTFKRLDIDNDDALNVSDIKFLLANNGAVSTDDEILLMIFEYDLNKDQKIDYEEFKRMIEGVALTTTSTRKDPTPVNDPAPLAFP